MNRIISCLFILFISFAAADAQTLKRVYDENADAMAQIDSALVEASTSHRYVICQVGGNWCKWCLRFADFISTDSEISEFIDRNYVYLHINSSSRRGENNNVSAVRRLGNPVRFGLPVIIVLDAHGNILHTQDSSYLEDGEGYDKAKVMRFLKNWTPDAVEGACVRR